MSSTLVFQGTIVHSLDPENLEILQNATLIVHDGRITGLYKCTDEIPQDAIPPAAKLHKLPFGDFLIPGFVDIHNHAPQWPMRGLGQGLHILDWLNDVTFPFEARFADHDYASSMYEYTVEDFLRHGITTASYYGSRHAEATRILAKICHKKGQRALVGKCNMDRNAPDYICEEDASASLHETEECIRHIRALDGNEDALVTPVVTPRFAICCTPELLKGLGDMIRGDDTLAMQTHFNEAQQEIDATKALFPEFGGSEADLYESYGLLNRRAILAHCTIMNDYEKERIKALQDFLRRGIKIGLGTDSGGGWASQMLAVIRQAMIASNAQEALSKGGDKALSLDEAFYLATMGGARVLCLEERIGSLEVGKELDAVWVTTTMGLQSAMAPRDTQDSPRRVFEKFIMTGDDRNMAHVYVRGRRVAGSK
ncbi:hypothetical protein B0J15DRAFT_571265, partial [Fusarium solani]